VKKKIFTAIAGLLLTICISGQSNEIVINNDIQLISLQDSVFIHTTWHESENYGRISSNGMVIIKNGQAIMVDTPMDNEKTEQLVVYLKDSLHVSLVKLIAGHYHADCIGGLGYLQNVGVESIANSMTVKKCNELGLPVPSTSFDDSLNILFNGLQIECRYFGGGHSADNIIVWIPERQILFGGCLVKSSGSKGLGNIHDAVLDEWDTTIEKILACYPDVRIVIPGHGIYGDKKLLYHTIDLVRKQ
jgi:metallo-beta-lactamase class B